LGSAAKADTVGLNRTDIRCLDGGKRPLKIGDRQRDSGRKHCTTGISARLSLRFAVASENY
jgi:hypothetical protein